MRPSADRDEKRLAPAGLHQLRAQSGVLLTALLSASHREAGRGQRDGEVHDRQPEGLGAFPGRGVVLVRPGALAGLGADDRFGHPPQTKRDKADRGHPEDHRAAGLAGQRRQGTGLIGIAAGPEGDAEDDVPDEQMQHAADGEARACGVFERVAVGRTIGDAVQRFVGHAVLYPLFDGGETTRLWMNRRLGMNPR